MLKTNELLLYKTGIIKLSEITTESKEKIKTECTPYSVVNTGNVIKQTEQFNKDIATNIVNKYKAIYYNNFVYNPSRINIGSIGVMQDEIGCVSPIYIVFKCNKDYIFYLEQLFKMSNMIKEINKRCSGSVRQALSYDSLCAIEIFDIQENKLNQYNKKCSIIKENILGIEKENQKLQQLKNNYLAKFF